MVGLKVGEVVDFGGYIYVPLRETVGVKVMFFMGDVEAGFGAFGMEFEVRCKFLVFKPPVTKAVSD